MRLRYPAVNKAGRWNTLTTPIGTENASARAAPAVEAALTATASIAVDYIPVPPDLGELFTTLYHFRCDEPEIHDIQPASVGFLCLFPHGKGAMHFHNGQVDSNPEVGIITPLTRAVSIRVKGPLHIVGGALSPLGWAALTGLHAREHADRLRPASELLWPGIDEVGTDLIAQYRSGTKSGRNCALELCRRVAEHARPINARHARLIRTIHGWLATSLNPDVSDLFTAADYSDRQVQRLAERYFGHSPQALARKYRALRAAMILSLPELTPESEAELGAAFFDQSHMIREITRFVGRTPARLRDASNPFLAEMIDPRNLRELGG